MNGGRGRRQFGPNVNQRLNEPSRAFGQMKRGHAFGFVQFIEKCGMQFNELVKRSRQWTQFTDGVEFGVGYCGVNKFKRVRVFFDGVPRVVAALLDLLFHFTQMHVQSV